MFAKTLVIYLITIALPALSTACVQESQAVPETQAEPELEWWELLLTYPPPKPPAWEFWLDEHSIAEAIYKSGAPWSISPIYAPLDMGRVYGGYELFSGTTLIGAVGAVTANAEQTLSGTFLHYQGDPRTSLADLHTQSRQDWDGFIVLFTNLFGGFDSPHQVLDYFNAEIDYIERQAPESDSTLIADVAVWEREINDVHITIIISRYYGRSEEHMRSIFMSRQVELE